MRLGDQGRSKTPPEGDAADQDHPRIAAEELVALEDAVWALASAGQAGLGTDPLIDRAGQDDGANPWSLSRTASCLREAAACLKSNGMLAVPEDIMAIEARTRTAGARAAAVGSSIFRLAQFLCASDPSYALSDDGLHEIHLRTREEIKENFPPPTPRPLPALDLPPLAGACELARLRWIRHKDLVEDAGNLAVLRLIIPSALAATGATKGWRLFLASALPLPAMRRLDELMERPAEWRSALVPSIGSAAAEQRNRFAQTAKLYQRWSQRLSSSGHADSARRNALEILFDRPILSRGDLMDQLSRKGRDIAGRTSLAILRDLEADGIIRKHGRKIWRSAEPLLLGS